MCSQTVETALRHVSQTIVLAGFEDPRRLISNSKDLDLPFQRLQRAYRVDDPVPKQQLALPVATLKDMAAHHTARNTPKDQRLADMITVASFFLLRPGEYCMTQRSRRTRTVQFRRQDVRMWKGQQLIPHTASLATLLTCDAAMLTIDNQKNGERGSVMHHNARHGPFCPVKALARTIKSILTLSDDQACPLSLFGIGQHLVSRDVTTAIRHAAVRTGLYSQGYTSTRISAHSLRASGAMSLKLGGKSDTDIQLRGRWSSDTWKTYIHMQIAALSEGFSETMATEYMFQNVAAN